MIKRRVGGEWGESEKYEVKESDHERRERSEMRDETSTSKKDRL